MGEQKVLSQMILFLFVYLTVIGYWKMHVSGDYFFACFFNSIYLWVVWLPFFMTENHV